MSNLNNLQVQLVSLSKELAIARTNDNQEMVEELEDQIEELEADIEAIELDDYDTKHGAQWH
jgi:cob(I)alamin adenosyltransferase